mgnify:CR=1 FL=1|tara:strand:+ start:1434 stop:1946 length:513 start_codon:yes stop_codon:yes gene_type:complete
MDIEKIETLITKIPDFPKKGILYYDLSSVIINSEAFKNSIEHLSFLISEYNFDNFAAIDARGFIFASALAFKLNKGVILVRKKNKLPGNTKSIDYELEYGKDSLEINQNVKDMGIILVDDLLATGGTGVAATKLLKNSGGDVRCFLSFIELVFLGGKAKFDIPVKTLIKY